MLCTVQELKPDYTSVEDLIFDVLALRKGNGTYHRDLKLPDVPVSPKAAMSEYEEEDTDTEEEDDSECAAAGNQSHQEENPPDTREFTLFVIHCTAVEITQEE